ncbi:MAG: PepSY domain-containing protein [Methylobacter sp.]|nr:PepSY domain-containing protein [Methylobacter sp.]MDP2430393.1 PepSY domain-containing protein [Methylobacter sp.]MDP3055624.1 PepSY domain-containing protein [Methylobacter sp.]MDP3362049.1 PepSY domain-containing protein [Methylobacter sp.]MDZ4219766.1 PepSY domain-containing protein [Methylobacter sp.]
MKITTITSILIFGFSASAPSYAAEQSIDSCIAAIQKQKTGTFIKLEKLKVAGKPFYEFEIKDAKGIEWEFMCDAETGKITETEKEVSSADDEAFKKNAKVTEKEAIDIALKAHPGTVEEVEYEIEANGDASYEIDIVNDKGVETKVEVNAASGKIIEVSVEEWEIGEEAEEKR